MKKIMEYISDNWNLLLAIIFAGASLWVLHKGNRKKADISEQKIKDTIAVVVKEAVAQTIVATEGQTHTVLSGMENSAKETIDSIIKNVINESQKAAGEMKKETKAVIEELKIVSSISESIKLNAIYENALLMVAYTVKSDENGFYDHKMVESFIHNTDSFISIEDAEYRLIPNDFEHVIAHFTLYGVNGNSFSFTEEDWSQSGGFPSTAFMVVYKTELTNTIEHNFEPLSKDINLNIEYAYNIITNKPPYHFEIFQNIIPLNCQVKFKDSHWENFINKRIAVPDDHDNSLNYDPIFRFRYKFDKE